MDDIQIYNMECFIATVEEYKSLESSKIEDCYVKWNKSSNEDLNNYLLINN